MEKFNDRFGKNLFDRHSAKKYLPSRMWKKLQQVCIGKATFTEKEQQKYAEALKKWALDKGVDRFSHWFQPLNNLSAGKRDSLFSVNGNGKAFAKFRTKELLQGEGDASSFPTGGMRQTFEARGVTSWDFSSTPFIKDGCLFVPSTFRSASGEALDKKTPLLRSCNALNKQAVRLLGLAGIKSLSVRSVVGAEQEYFLIDEKMFLRRPDLVMTGKTLLGTLPPKTQQLNDHYYRLPDEKILQFWHDVDAELQSLGIIVKTEHREVAPCQFELAPCYAPVNVACDQNQLIMQVLKSVAKKHSLVCLLHEKPFNGVNGSGKHNNWSLLTFEGQNLFEPTPTEKGNGVFLLMLMCVVSAVDKHQDLLLTSVCNASNDCRLGGFEAPPCAISLFLGNELHCAVQRFFDGDAIFPQNLHRCRGKTDRNRTSPLAFTGNKFEFRMAGSSSSLADCNIVLNTILADEMQIVADRLQNSRNFWADAKIVMKEMWQQHKKIVFNGNNYSAKWRKQSQRRKLVHFENAAQALQCLCTEKNVRLFEGQGVYSAKELCAMQQILLENYCNTLQIEGKTMLMLLNRHILPFAEKYLFKRQRLVQACNCRDEFFQTQEWNLLTEAKFWCGKLKKSLLKYDKLPLKEKAMHCACNLLPVCRKLRNATDSLEDALPQKVWQLPSYGEILRIV